MKFHDGINAQPEVLATSAQSVSDSLAGISPIAPDTLVSLIGIGASEHVANSAAVTWRSLGIRTIAQPASEFLGGSLPIADLHVALSESGCSSETLTALEQISTPSVAVTNGPDSPIARAASELLFINSGPDSPVYTTGYTATLQAMGLLGEHWSGKHSDWSRLPMLVHEVLDASNALIQDLAEQFDAARIIDVVGTRTASAASGEGALMLREAARAHTAAHETQNYLHGPMEPLDERTACIVIGSGRELRLAADVQAIGCPTLLITDDPEIRSEGNLHVLTLPETGSPLARAVLEILPLQVLARTLADARGLLVDGFRYRQTDTKIGEVLARASDATD